MNVNRKICLYCFLAMTIMSKLWGIGFFFFIHSMPTELPSTQTVNTEAIVVLTGGRSRIDTGIELLKKNPSKILFITGINSRLKKIPNVIKISARLPKASQNKVEFGYRARSTFENALETKAWLNSHHIKSITLVTATYHIPRSMLEFEKAMPNVQIKCYPVFPSGFKINKWWFNPRSAIFLFKEYVKYSVAFTRIYISNIYARYFQTA